MEWLHKYRNVLPGVLAILVVGGALFVYSHIQRQESHYKFALDYLHALVELKESREDDDSEDENVAFLTQAYAMQEHLSAARADMTKWIDVNDSSITEIVTTMLDGLADLDEASDIYLRFAKGQSYQPEADLALLKVKFDSGRSKVLRAAFSVTELSLNEAQRSNLIDYIDRNFKEELAQYSSYLAQGTEDYSLPQEVWAAIFIEETLLPN